MLHRVLTGYYVCPTCDERFEADDAREHELVCPDCNVALEVADDDSADDLDTDTEESDDGD